MKTLTIIPNPDEMFHFYVAVWHMRHDGCKTLLFAINTANPRDAIRFFKDSVEAYIPFGESEPVRSDTALEDLIRSYEESLT